VSTYNTDAGLRISVQDCAALLAFLLADGGRGTMPLWHGDLSARLPSLDGRSESRLESMADPDKWGGFDGNDLEGHGG
jgi:hypothetical protein